MDPASGDLEQPWDGSFVGLLNEGEPLLPAAEPAKPTTRLGGLADPVGLSYPGAYAAAAPPAAGVGVAPAATAQLLMGQGNQPVMALQQMLQQQQAAQQGFLLQQQRGGFATLGSFGAYGYAPYSYQALWLGTGQQPAAKRQAIDARQMALLQAQSAGNPSLAALLQQKSLAPAPVFGAAAAAQLAATNGAGTMRVDVAKGGQAWKDGKDGFLAEDTTAKDHTEEVMKRCEEISRRMKQQLGKHVDGERFGATGTEGDDDAEGDKFHAATQAQLIEACGDTSRFLKPYQARGALSVLGVNGHGILWIVGVNFLLLLYRQKVGGAILADEMGLGKTSQLINYLGAIRHLENDPGPHLVVVPASLLENWQRELHRWCPALKVGARVVVYYGKHRAAMRKRLLAIKTKMERGEEVDDDISDLTDPALLAELHQSDKAEEAAALAAAEDAFDDDPASRTGRSCCRRARRRGAGGGGGAGAGAGAPPAPAWRGALRSSVPLGDESEIQELTDRMKQLLTPFVLRRLKTEVADQLTAKTHVTEMIEMTPEQGQIYANSVQSMRSQISGKAAAAAADKSDKGVRTHYSDEDVASIAEMAFQREIFTGNVTLKRVQVGGRARVQVRVRVRARVREELLTYSDFSLHAFCYNHGPDFAHLRLDPSVLMSSAKFRFLATLLPELKARGSRPLIFSQWTAVLDIMEWLMDVLQLPYVRLDGSTAVDERLSTVDRFNHSDDVFAFLLSTRAGGQGLNLTGADTVVLHDVDFNPQIDKQAEDRCHRLGQTKPVYRLITKNSVDQNIHNLSQRKLRLDAAVLDGITYDSRAGKGEERQQMAYWPFHKTQCKRNEFADLAEESEPKFARWMRSHGKLAVLKDDEVDRLERAGAATTGPGREEVMESMYGRLEPKPRGAALWPARRFVFAALRCLSPSRARPPPALSQEEADKAAARRALEVGGGRPYASIELPPDLGLDCQRFKWRQSQSHVEVFVPLPEGVGRGKVAVALSTRQLSVEIDERPVLVGELWREVKAEESTWYMQARGRRDGVLEIVLLKRCRRGHYEAGTTNADTYWPAVLRGAAPHERLPHAAPPLAYYSCPYEGGDGEQREASAARRRIKRGGGAAVAAAAPQLVQAES
eukprot:scaffold18.g1899.t1